MLKKIVIGFSVFIVSVVAAIAWYFSDNIKGYYKFKHLCETEGGLKLYEKLEPNVGWEASDKYNGFIPAGFEEVSFVRFPSEKDNSKFFDFKYRDGLRDRWKSYEIFEANESLKIKYKFILEDGVIDRKLLISKAYLKVMDVEKDTVSLEFVSFSYSMFDKKKTIFAAPSGTRCFQVHPNIIGDNFK